jgi:hypothetical protein
VAIAGDAYAALVKEQLDGAYAKQASFEQRGIAVVTTSGTLASLLFGLVAAITTKSGFTTFSTVAQILILGALTSFLGAAVFGLFVNRPRLRRSVVGIDPGSFRQQVMNMPAWTASSAEGSLAATEVRLEMLNDARIGNGIRARVLSAAFALEGLAAVLLAGAVADILFR